MWHVETLSKVQSKTHLRSAPEGVAELGRQGFCMTRVLEADSAVRVQRQIEKATVLRHVCVATGQASQSRFHFGKAGGMRCGALARPVRCQTS